MRDQNTPELEDDDIARLLQAAGPREQIPGSVKESWDKTFRAELERVQSNRRGKRRRFIGAVAATVAAITLGSLVLRQSPPDVPEVRVVAVAGVGEVDLAPVQPGDLLAVGAGLNTGPDGRLAISWGGYDLRFDAKTKAVLESGGVKLEQGRLYVSDDGGFLRHRLTVNTAQAAIRDIGTQFLVAVSPEGTEATVRQGAIVIATGSEEIQTRARVGLANRVQIDNRRQATTTHAAASGRDWEWIYTVTPPHEIEGESAYEFLRWSTGESGLQLEFSDAHAEYYARNTILHGSFGEQGPDSAVEMVLATTDLVPRREGDTLRISLKPSL